MKAKLKLLPVLLVSAVVLVVAFLVWANFPVGPGPEALAALQSDNVVSVSETEGYILFEPAAVGAPARASTDSAGAAARANEEAANADSAGSTGTASALPAQESASKKPGILLYPGGHMDPRGYAPLLRQLAVAGYKVAIAKVALNMPLLDVEAGARAMAALPDVGTWVVGGHFLGAVAAARLAQGSPDIAGIIFLGSWPADGELRGRGMKALALWGSEDRNMDEGERIARNVPRFPEDTLFFPVEGANASAFGDFASDPSAGAGSLLPVAEQRDITARAILEFLDYVAGT